MSLDVDDKDAHEAVRLIAIGASAGGLEPIEQFFDAVDPSTKMAYVIVQHLSPDFKSMMPQLLERHSDLRIRQVEDGMAIEPATIYLTPPRSSVEIAHRQFGLVEKDVSYDFSLPINYLFESLARTYGNKAIGVVLSGTGSDGTLGAEAITAAGGVVLAQDPSSSKFDSMPRSVISAVPGAIYAHAGKLPQHIEDIIEGKSVLMPPLPAPADLTVPEKDIVRLLQVRFGLDFGYYKTTTVGRRISRRAQLLSFQELDDYAEHLTRNPEELEALYADLLIGVTAFFRDQNAYDALSISALPQLGNIMAKGEEVRVWAPGCASGEEPFSLAILLAERAKLLNVELRLRIFATDIHPRSLRIASRGIYDAEALSGVPPEFRDRYFSSVGENFQIVKELRDCVVFSKHNMLRDPPFTKIDLVSCRNLLIYFDNEAQRKSIAMFHFALRKQGVLFLGPSETLGALTEEFVALDGRWRIFSKKRDIRLVESSRMLPLTSGRTTPLTVETTRKTPEFSSTPTSSSLNVNRNALLRIYDAALSAVLGTSMLISRNGELLHIFGDAGSLLSIGRGQFTRKVLQLVDDQLRLVIKAGLDRSQTIVDEVYSRTVALPCKDSEEQRAYVVTMQLLQVAEPVDDAPILLSITPQAEGQEPSILPDMVHAKFDEVGLQQRISGLERDLQFSEETLQTTIEELESANEELQATNEELQATNEELMAANEELQTVNEELHAVNEELYTVSAEHHKKITELTNLSSDLDNLLSSTHIGVLFLDAELNVRQLTPAISATFNILLRDIGRPIAHVTYRFEFPDLASVVQSVIDSGSHFEQNITVEGNDYLLRILPYRIGEAIDGAVLTFVDISEIARANRNLRQFADIVSHDLQAPLRAIRQTSEWVVEDLGDAADDTIKTHTKRLIEQTDKLALMLTDLRDFSSLEQDRDKVELVDTNALLQEIGTFYRSEELELELDDGLPRIDTRRAALRLVFQNLIDNAVKYRMGDKAMVSIAAMENEGLWTFTINDNGPGIEPRFHEKIFLPFRKLRDPSASSGSGIGLALVKKTVEDHGGTIHVVSDPKDAPGTTFVINWPEEGLQPSRS